MQYKLKVTFRPKVLNDKLVAGTYSDAQLKAAGFFFESPEECVEAPDKFSACNIITDKYQDACGIINPDAVVTIFAS